MHKHFWIYAAGFEAGGPHTPSNIDPWSIVGDDSSIFVATDRTSCFSRNIVALRMEVLCDDCPAGGVGIYNPGFWGMVRLCVDCMFSHIFACEIDNLS